MELSSSQLNSYTTTELCRINDISRQAYYQSMEHLVKEAFQKEILLSLVNNVRYRQPRIGGLKLLHILNPELEKLGYKVGRDKFFAFLRENNLLIHPVKKYHRTTDSVHFYDIYPNLAKDVQVNDINQVFVADLTYLSTQEGFIYLFLLTDLFSRQIVGYELSDSLHSKYAVAALAMALSYLRKGDSLVHHSDRGIQYCSFLYTDILKASAVKISMSAKGNPYENAYAERVNNTIKNEFVLNSKFFSLRSGKAFIQETIEIYNKERPHRSLKLKTPYQVYFEKRKKSPNVRTEG